MPDSIPIFPMSTPPPHGANGNNCIHYSILQLFHMSVHHRTHTTSPYKDRIHYFSLLQGTTLHYIQDLIIQLPTEGTVSSFKSFSIKKNTTASIFLPMYLGDRFIKVKL